jgi:hypothetical protein
MPANTSKDHIVTPATIEDALKIGVQTEIDNIAMYKGFLDKDLPEDGSMTIREAADLLQMDLPEFYSLFQIPAEVPAQTKMKDIGIVSPGYDLEKIKGLLE